MASKAALAVALACVFASSALQSVNGFYLPGVAPRQFLYGDPVDLKVNKITSTHTQLPYRYYSVPGVCIPPEVVDKVENLGEILAGDRIESSSYEIKTGVAAPCKVLCKNTITKEQAAELRQYVKDEYRVHWVMDNLPAATPMIMDSGDGSESQLVYDAGFWLGGSIEAAAGQEPQRFLNNHHAIKIRYHQDPKAYDGRRIVGFEVEPSSHAYSNTNPPKDGDCGPRVGQLIIPDNADEMSITWTYSVTWEEDETPWANRWDRYFFNIDPQIHWFAIVNSLMIVLFLSGMVGMILLRALNADIRRYNMADADEEAEETGWKLVHGDVFRPPSHPLVLAVLVGSGQQIFVCAIVTLVFALLGFLSPANRGGLLTAMVVLFVVAGAFAGYGSTRIYKMLGGTRWKRCALFTSTALPGTLFGIFFFLNFFIWGEKSSGAVPFGTLVAICGLWCGISLPLVYFGAYFAWKKPSPDQPVRTNTIPRQVPEQVWYMGGVANCLMGGVLPFGAVFIELFFIMTAIWGQQFYYLFGFLFLVFIILVITSAEISMVMTYFQLCAEDYHWWWRSFLTAGSSALYMFLYAIFYFFQKLEITNFVSALMYFGYSLIMCIIFFVFTGAVGYTACYWFVRKIYGNVKVD